VEVSVPDNGKAAALVSTDTGLICASCGAETYAGELFCENCGAELPATGDGVGTSRSLSTGPATEPVPVQGGEPVFAAACTACGGTIAPDGYCAQCGAPAVKERDHWVEQPAPWVAAVCDRGIRHHRNEDAMALSARAEPEIRAILVVCDGVSSSLDPDIASLAAARAARDVLAAGDPDSPSVAGRISNWTDLLIQAAASANAEAVEVSRHPTRRPGERQDSPPSCTFVAVVIDGPLIVAGWVGDSRAYWLPDVGPAEQLSVDDSWATEQILSGMPRQVAEAAPQAHAITRWLGKDSPDFVPKCTAATPETPGWLLICSDGLWNYCSTAEDMAVLVSQAATAAGGDPAGTAAELVGWANAQGGQDNITVGLARLEPQQGMEQVAGFEHTN
jgi:serine/threonine protein phosphatase PrpC